MADAEGYGVRVVVECYGKDGERWSETANHWFGVSNEHTMNVLASGCIRAMLDFITDMNEVKYGDAKEAKQKPER